MRAGHPSIFTLCSRKGTQLNHLKDGDELLTRVLLSRCIILHKGYCTKKKKFTQWVIDVLTILRRSGTLSRFQGKEFSFPIIFWFLIGSFYVILKNEIYWAFSILISNKRNCRNRWRIY